jgi:retron-type reverse transcriptase
VCVERHEGTPQGGSLPPLLVNLLLDDLDKELEKRGTPLLDLSGHFRIMDSCVPERAGCRRR